MRAYTLAHTGVLAALMTVTTVIAVPLWALAGWTVSEAFFGMHGMTSFAPTFVSVFSIVYLWFRKQTTGSFTPFGDLAKRVDGWFDNPQNDYMPGPDRFLNRPSVILGMVVIALLFLIFVFLPNS